MMSLQVETTLECLVLTLRFEEEMKLEEIAAVLALPVGTVKTRLHRALNALRQLLEQQSGAEDRT